MKSAVLEVGGRLGIPVRHFDAHVRYDGSFYGQGRNGLPFPELIRVDALLELIRSLGPGVTELGCHPGYPDGLVSGYLRERAVEVQTLCDARVRQAVAEAGVELRSFRDELTAG